MWSYINKEDFKKYIEEYPFLKEHKNEISLYETADSIILPRLFYKNYPSELIHVRDSYKEHLDAKEIKVNFKGELRDVQKRASKTVLDIFNNNKREITGTIKMPPGTGKTVTTVYLSSKIGLKTCIIINNKNLMSQWIKAYINFTTNISENDIGLIQGSIFSVDKPIVVAMLQTLLSKIKTAPKKTMDDLQKAGIGLVVYDEVHSSSSSEKFSKVSILFKTNNFIGLSATPFHTGLHKILMQNTIGDIIFSSEDYQLIPQLYFIYYFSGISNNLSEKKTKKGTFLTVGTYVNMIQDLNMKRAIYNKSIVHSEKYLKIISKYIGNLHKKGYTTLIATMHINQLNTIADQIELDHNNIKVRRFYSKNPDIDKENDRVVAAPLKYCGEGFDFPRFDCIIITMPLSGKKSIIQLCGRALRTCDGKNDPIILYLVDMDFPSMFIKDVQIVRNIVKTEFKGIKVHEYNES
jgi:superfamily II DNA or RNA helicase